MSASSRKRADSLLSVSQTFLFCQDVLRDLRLGNLSCSRWSISTDSRPAWGQKLDVVRENDGKNPSETSTTSGS